ncbi:MAG: glycerol-3-phosphate 1-O-acyltransferase PlsB [Steroidobacteraceae bacterium]
MSEKLTAPRASFWMSLWVRCWARPRSLPEQFIERLSSTRRPVCFVLPTNAAADQEVLRRVLQQPEWRQVLAAGSSVLNSGEVICLQRWVGFWGNRLDHRLPAILSKLVASVHGAIKLADASHDVDLIPVSVFWGRAPDKEASWWRLRFGETWAVSGGLHRLLAVMINGRNLVVQFGEPVSMRAAIADAADVAQATRRVGRVCRSLLYRQRVAAIGPEVASRSSIVAQVLRTQAVRQAMRNEMRSKGLTRRQATQAAKKCVDEIAANYSHVTVTLLARLFKRIWNRLYDGVELHHLENLQSVVDTHEVVYVPCHRSHMDYLLLSYVIYQSGYAIPHIAAGVNLDLPIVGRILRQGGAFFIRRSFAGNPLYTTVFTKYLGLMMARGHAIEYFIEGGRSRTGRLLQPKTGALTMTVRSFLRDPKRPVVFVPVYFGYERVVESGTYIHELSGKPKQKESIWGMLKALPALRRKFGKVHVSLAEPILLDDMLAQHAPTWREAALEDKPTWMGGLVDDLALRIMRNINSAAYVTPINLLAMVLLATPKQAMLEDDLIRQLDLYASLLRRAPYSKWVTLTDLKAADMIAYAESMNILRRHAHAMGDVLSMTEQSAVEMTYFRNNILHLMVMPSALASCFLNNRQVRTEDLQRLAWRIYPYVCDELFLRWNEAELTNVVQEILQDFAAHGLLESSDDGASWSRPAVGTAEAVQLSVLGQLSMQIVGRYYLAIALLLKAGSSRISQDALEQQCHLMAQRMSLLYELNSPEFFDKSLFKNFLDLLRARGVLGVNAEGRLTYTDLLFAVADDAQLVLHEQIRNSILQVTHR